MLYFINKLCFHNLSYGKECLRQCIKPCSTASFELNASSTCYNTDSSMEKIGWRLPSHPKTPTSLLNFFIPVLAPPWHLLFAALEPNTTNLTQSVTKHTKSKNYSLQKMERKGHLCGNEKKPILQSFPVEHSFWCFYHTVLYLSLIETESKQFLGLEPCQEKRLAKRQACSFN